MVIGCSLCTDNVYCTASDRLIDIAKQEGMLMEQNAAEILAEQVGNDIRQVNFTTLHFPMSIVNTL